MLLNRLRRADRGSTLVPVVGLVAVAGILTTLIAAVSVQALSFTSLNRAGVQAQAAADAGVEFMRAQLATGSCPTDNAISKTYGEIYTGAAGSAELDRLGIDPSQPYFDVTVQHNALLSGTWADGCPTSLLGIVPTSVSVRIESTGYASAPGIGGASGLDSQTVEAVHAWSPAPSGPPEASGAAIYVGGSTGMQNPFNVDANGGTSDVHVRSGDFTCHAGGRIEGNVLVADGDALIYNVCEITGSLIVAGRVQIDAGIRVGGDVVAAGGDVTISNANTVIGGSVRAAGKVTIRGEVQGSVVSASTQTSTIDGNVGTTIGGNLRVAGDLSTWGYDSYPGSTTNEKIANFLQATGRVGGTVTYRDTTTPVPPAPVVSDWYDYQYDLADWPGYLYVPWIGNCTVQASNELLHTTYTLMKTSIVPLVVDARSCNRVTFNSRDIVVRADLVLLTKALTLGNADLRSGDGGDHKIWLITPDGNASAAGPNCSGGLGTLTNWTGTTVEDEITAFAYTPCEISFNNPAHWRGQIYAGKLTVHTSSTLTYSPIGLPGLDDEGGGGSIIPGLPGLGTIGTLESYQLLPGPTG